MGLRVEDMIVRADTEAKKYDRNLHNRREA